MLSTRAQWTQWIYWTHWRQWMDPETWISVTDAAKRLGVHRNTIHLRCDKKIYDCEFSDGPKGRQKWIRLASLEQTHTTPQEPPHESQGPISHAAPPEASAAILSVLSPILERLAATERENGRLTERVRQLEEQINRDQEPEAGVDMSPRLWWERLFGRGKITKTT